ncbi:hypothetical protein B5K11_04210 [Rhizobium leguminosarum bv. trifolii]|nr:hypothetical protein B5K11_04210 [Rhizobium leguminosarum bv. trifolii]
MAAPHPNPTGVEPRVSTRPSDPRLRGEGTCPARRWRGRKRLRHIPFAPRAGRRCRQADEGLASPVSWGGA